MTLLILLPLVGSIHACSDANQGGHAPTILQHQPDVPSIGDRKYRDRDTFGAGGASGTGGSSNSGTGGTPGAPTGGTDHGGGGQGGAGLGGEGGELPW